MGRNSILGMAQLEWDCLSNCSRAGMDLSPALLQWQKEARFTQWPQSDPQSMNFLLSQWGDGSKDSRKSLEPRKQSVPSTSSPSATKSDVLISSCYLWQTSWVMQRSYLLLSILIKFGSVEKKKKRKKKRSNPVPSSFSPSNSIICQIALRIH